MKGDWRRFERLSRGRRQVIIALATLTIGSLLVFAAPAVRAQEDDERDDRDVVVRLIPGASIAELAQKYSARINDHVPNSNIYTLEPPPTTTLAAFISALHLDYRVEVVEENQVLGTPEFDGDPMHLPFDHTARPDRYVSHPAYSQVNLGKAWSRSTGMGIVVAVLDTGAAVNHPVLANRLVPGFNAISPASAPLDVPDGVNNAVWGHGTMVAGIVVRIAPGASIMPIRVLNGDGVGRLVDVVKGIQYAMSHGARIINMSFGAPRSSGLLRDAIDRAADAGVLVVAAAGNEGLEKRQYPAALEPVLSVAALESDNEKAVYSNYGSFVRVAAPGSSICSTFADGGYASWSGTSFAAPFVSAEAALLLSSRAKLKAEDTAEIIIKSAQPVDAANPAFKGKLGRGIIDIEKALKKKN